MTAVEAVGVGKSYGAHRVLDGFDLVVPPAALAVVVGPSGSGKTTFLRLLAGFERIDAGRLTLCGVEVDGARYLPPERRGTSYVPQEGALFPHLTVARNVAFGIPRGVDRTDRRTRVGELLDLVGLAGLGRRYPHQLSGGQQQRVALARALAPRPKVVLLDEPFSSLDAGLRASVRSDVRRVLRDAGTTAILVTHDQDEALSFADLVAVLQGGRIVQCATPADLYRRPLGVDIASFVGQANLVAATAHDGLAECALGRVALCDPFPDGTPLTLLLRPEQLGLEPVPSGAATAVVTHHEFYGHDAMVRVRLAAGDHAELLARTAGGQPLTPGTPVRIRLQGTGVAWPADAPTAATSDVGKAAPGGG